jgi:hypothetical protein
VYRRILGPVYDSEKEIYVSVIKPTVIETIRLNRLLFWTCTENGKK